MSVREKAPFGSPCWTDLWTSDVESSRTFYSELFGWKAEEPSPDFGGYFIFTREGTPVAGGMGDMGDMRANNTWTVYLATTDCDRTVADATSAGATISYPPMAVADLGTQSAMEDPTGAHLGIWQANTFEGITVFDEDGAPGWFELHTRDYKAALDFYQSVFHWETDSMGDSDEFRYSTVRNPAGGGGVAGVMDFSSYLPEGQSSYWTVYWTTDDIDASAEKLKALGGSVIDPAVDTPYGRIGTYSDPSGAKFRLRRPPQ